MVAAITPERKTEKKYGDREKTGKKDRANRRRRE